MRKLEEPSRRRRGGERQGGRWRRKRKMEIGKKGRLCREH